MLTFRLFNWVCDVSSIRHDLVGSLSRHDAVNVNEWKDNAPSARSQRVTHTHPRMKGLKEIMYVLVLVYS